MAHHKQALKRYRQSEERKARNRSYKRTMKTELKKAETLATDGSAEDKAAAIRSAMSVIAKTAAKNVIPKKRAARKISRLTKALQKK